MNFEQANGSLSETDKTFEPLFIEEDEDYFEDCLEEIEAALTLPGESMPYSIKCREALQAEFNGLMQQMLSQLDAFDAAHPTTAPLGLFSMDKNGFTKTIEFGETCIPEKEQTVLEVEDNAVGIPVEARSEFSATMEIQKLREVFESCIEEVGQLERRRDELVQELLELEEPMAQELQSVRGDSGGRTRPPVQSQTGKTKSAGGDSKDQETPIHSGPRLCTETSTAWITTERGGAAQPSSGSVKWTKSTLKFLAQDFFLY